MSALRELSRALGAPRGGLLLRILPPALYVGRARMLILRASLVWRNGWIILLSGLLEPLLFLTAMGQGLGGLVGTVVGPAGQQLSYAAFLAPGLLAASAMNGAVYDAVYRVFAKLKQAKLYDAVLATPLGPMDIALGEIGWALIRGGMYSAGFLGIMLVTGLISSPWAVLALPVALFVAFAFASVGMAATSFLRSWQDFELVQLVMLPMFLFSGTFFPLSMYSPAARWLAQASPLYHAVTLLRDLTTGAVGWSMLGHGAYLAAMAVVGVVVASRRLKALLMR